MLAAHEPSGGGWQMGSQFPKLFRQYYNIHATIHAILGEVGTSEPDLTEVERRVRERHPDINMGPAVLAAAIRQAVTDTAALSKK